MKGSSRFVTSCAQPASQPVTPPLRSGRDASTQSRERSQAPRRGRRARRKRGRVVEGSESGREGRDGWARS
eukprot:158422-Rhodomonas_salina.1